MILFAWRLMPAKVHPHCNGKTWESQIYFTNRTLSENESPFALRSRTPERCRGFLAAPLRNIFHQSHFE